MWIFTSGGFVSVVRHRKAPDMMIVRGRFAGDASRFLDLPLCAEEEDTGADYRFRCYAHRDTVSAAVLRSVAEIDYPNFKDSLKQRHHKEAAMDCWSALNDAQRARHGPRFYYDPSTEYDWPPRPPGTVLSGEAARVYPDDEVASNMTPDWEGRRSW